MRRPFRILGIVIVVLVIAIAGAMYYFASNVDGIVENLIEEHGSAATGTAVRVDGVSIDLGAATGSISGLTVANPDGFDGQPAIELGNLRLALDAGSLLGDPIIIESIEADEATLAIVQSGTRNNLQALLDNLRADAGPEPDPGEAGPRVVIERFALTGATASVAVHELDEQRAVDVPDIVLTDIGARSGGATGKELARQILEPLLREVLESAAAESVEDRVRDELSERADGVLDGLGDGLGNRLGIGDDDDDDDDGEEDPQ